VVRVTDVPLALGGGAYLVERGLEQDGNSALRASIVDHVHCAELSDAIPMAAPML
jgi:hypothetical protein